MAKKKIQALVAQMATHDNFGQFRFIKTDDGEIYFVAKDVCKILGLKNPSKSLKTLKENEFHNFKLENYGKPGNPNVLCVNEPGLYRLIFRSRKPEAEKFQDWIYHEVLPSIRKNGYYGVEKAEQSDEPKENLLEDWKPTGTFEDVATVTNILDQKGIEYDYDITSITFEYNEELGMVCPTYDFKLKIKD